MQQHVNEQVLCMSKDGTRIGYKKTRKQKITNFDHIFSVKRPSNAKHVGSGCEDDCSICCNNFSDCGVYTAKCGHQFHLECIVTWYSKHNTCPLCRRSDIEYPLCIQVPESL